MHVISNMLHLQYFKICPNLMLIFWPLYIVMVTHYDRVALFYRCHDVLAW